MDREQRNGLRQVAARVDDLSRVVQATWRARTQTLAVIA